MRSLMEDEAKLAFEIGPNGIALDLLQMVYRSSSVELTTRLKCAMACLPFESPKLIATAIVNEGSFADLLDKRIKRLQEMEMKTIEAKPTNNGQVDAKPPLPRLPDRRFRRI